MLVLGLSYMALRDGFAFNSSLCCGSCSDHPVVAPAGVSSNGDQSPLMGLAHLLAADGVRACDGCVLTDLAELHRRCA